ncbi:MAG TPA: hypothetical protein VGV38_15535, partial [Pyrinomonadaceae bacterium]|nr:hypothetical protein [Pyrinomonadaceae bacterium]
MRDFKVDLTRPTGHLRPLDAPAPREDGLFRRLLEAAREFKARPRETLSDLFSTDAGLLRPRPELAKLLGASAVVHVVLLVVLLFSGVLAPLLAPEDEEARRDYEVTMLAPQKLPPAPWRAVQTPDFTAGPEAFVTQTPADVPPAPMPQAPAVSRPRIFNPGPAVVSQPSLGGAGGEATPTPTPGATPQATPAQAGSTRNPSAAASPRPSSGTPAPNATPAAGATPAPSPNYLGDAVGRVYARYLGEAGSQTPPPANFSVEADFKAEADGKLSDPKITPTPAPPEPPVLFEGMQEVLTAAGEARSFQNLSKLCTRNGIRLETDE